MQQGVEQRLDPPQTEEAKGRPDKIQQYQPRDGHLNTTMMLQCIENLQVHGREIIREKNARYAGNSDPYKNFRRHGLYGIVVRMDDKMSRLSNLLKPGSVIDETQDESIYDTILDLMNYAAILAAARIGGKFEK